MASLTVERARAIRAESRYEVARSVALREALVAQKEQSDELQDRLELRRAWRGPSTNLRLVLVPL